MQNKKSYYLKIIPQSRFTFHFDELIEFRHLLYVFVWRDIKIRYKQTFLGVLWVIIQPFVMMIVFTSFVKDVLKIPEQNMPYPIYVFSGLILWNAFTSSINGAGESMMKNAEIIKKIYFPRILIPLSAVVTGFFDFLVAFFAFLILLGYFNYSFDFVQALLLWPLAVLCVFVTSFGTGAFISAMNVKYRDFRYILPFTIQALFFLTPIIYAQPSYNSKWVSYVMSVNPMSLATTLFRVPLSASGLELDWVSVAITTFSMLLLFFIGILHFRRAELYFADLI